LYIKNMVCDRCIMVVRQQLTHLGYEFLSVELGTVSFSQPLTQQDIKTLKDSIEPLGFEVIDDKRFQLIEQVKNLIVKLVHYKNNDLKVNLSQYIASQLHQDYSYISNLFSELEGTTIEQYFIAQKIEKVKELLDYDELSLSEIADTLNYSSVAHLSTQFKKVTKLTPSQFKQRKQEKRKPLDKI
ncbi:MAG: AraC family transcriptional regulator, partial [Bacteroides sp.]|nr:AraC family transcriptional regulator [Bacteroides sp.]